MRGRTLLHLRLPVIRPANASTWSTNPYARVGQTEAKVSSNSEHLIDVETNFSSMAIDDDDLLDCFIHLPGDQEVPFVLNYQTIRDAQVKDARLVALQQAKPKSYADQLLGPDTTVTCYIPEPGAPWRIYLPTGLLDNSVRWYHLALGHP